MPMARFDRVAARAALAVVSASVSVCVFLTAPANAAGCEANSCVGKDPDVYCSPGYTKFYHEDPAGEATGSYAYWQERRNDDCRSAWVRVGFDTSNISYLVISYQGAIQSRVGSDNSTAVTKYTPVITPSAFSQSKASYSTMVSNGTGKNTRYCWRTNPNTGAGWNDWTCSSWH